MLTGRSGRTLPHCERDFPRKKEPLFEVRSLGKSETTGWERRVMAEGEKRKNLQKGFLRSIASEGRLTAVVFDTFSHHTGSIRSHFRCSSSAQLTYAEAYLVEMKIFPV